MSPKKKPSWNLPENTYSVDSFYTMSRDPTSEGVPVTFRVPASLLKKVNAMFPATIQQYTSPSDFWRDAAVHRLHWLEATEIIPADDTLTHIRLSQKRVDTEAVYTEFFNSLTTLKDQINKLLQINGESQALLLLQNFITDIKTMDDAWWRDKYMELLQSEYPDLIRKLGESS